MDNAKKFFESPGFRTGLKIATLVVLLLVMLVPLALIRSLVEEREARLAATAAELMDLHGGRQTLVGPLLVVPVVVREVDAEGIARQHRREIGFIPQSLTIGGTIEPELLRRGIYEVPVYDSRIELRGEMRIPDADEFPDASIVRIVWDDARLVLGIAGVSGLRTEPRITVDGAVLEVEASSRSLGETWSGIAAPLGLTGSPAPDAPSSFTIELELSGGGSLHLVATARRSSASLDSSWPSPSFSGDVLPSTREITDGGFLATWETTALGMGMPDAWDLEQGGSWLYGSRIGVDLFQPVDAYHQTIRSVKYGILFVLLPLAALFLLETLTAIRIHPVQYLLVSAAKVVFYLVLLSLAEHLGFTIAYWSGAAATVVLVTSYVAAFTKRVRHALAIGAMIAAEYVFLFASLQSEDYALLIGSLGLFVLLAAVMIATRRINWYEAAGE